MGSMRTQPLMLDVDTGVDDAAAIAMAIGLRANLVAVSTVAGNVPIDYSTDNTLRVLSLLGKVGVPVYRGASRPLVAPYQDAAHVHGGNGLGGAELPVAQGQEGELTGPEAIIHYAERHAGELTLVTLGPLTNLAIALSLRPQLTRQIANVVVMGGAFFTPGNVTPHAEFNIYVDPDAAQQVFDAPWNAITAVGLDVTHQTVLSRGIWEAIPADAGAATGLMRDIAARTFLEREMSGFYLHDPLAVGVALDPSLVSGTTRAIDVTTDEKTRGKTTVRDAGHVLVGSEVKAEPFVRRFCDALGLRHVADAAGLANAE
jgi:inosine-uridine nucleoside N-ribohydrolase